MNLTLRTPKPKINELKEGDKMATKVSKKNINAQAKSPSVKNDLKLSQEKNDLPFPIVGIGASAGGLKAFEQFFLGLPENKNPGMAFVIVQHLQPDHKSILTNIVQRFTSMDVLEITNGLIVEKNTVYIIPPNNDLVIQNRSLQLLKPKEARGHRLPIDTFFRSLAKDQQDHAIGIILSGTGSDGTLGVKAINAESGLVIVQTPASCEFDGMPTSAIATCRVDFQLPPIEMMPELLRHYEKSFNKLSKESTDNNNTIEENLNKVFIILKAQIGHDFSQYKRNTINRRIERRMSVAQIDSLENYVEYLQKEPSEVEALFKDMLIGVTNFFRDPEIFLEMEEKILPKVFDNKPAIGGVVRIWSAGCSTGEEAYSIAILIQEHMQRLKKSFTVQIFATDIDAEAISRARSGIYPLNIGDDISKERLQRFFSIEPDGKHYRIHKSIRDMLIFSEQNIIKDPPFSKLDLLICRNLLIYFNIDLQEKLIPLFHYALKPTGLLFLGASEGLGNFEEMFNVLDRKSKFYQRKDHPQNVKRPGSHHAILPKQESHSISPTLVTRTTPINKLPYREMTEQTLLQQIAPAAALVNKQGDIFYLHGRTGMYLEPMQGEVETYNIFNMAREGLKPSLLVALKKVEAIKEVVQVLNLRVKTNGHFTQVNLSIHPIKGEGEKKLETALYLIIFEDVKTTTSIEVIPTSSQVPNNAVIVSEDQIVLLEHELKDKDKALKQSLQELQSFTEELKSSNEEMQSVNEELQSTNEELETSKEELQSLNEELATVNNELNAKVLDLSRINNDMNNLLAGAEIAMIFVDLRLNIMRFTPTAAQIINLIKSDIGRPIGHLVLNLAGYNSLIEDTQSVLETLQPKDLDVKTLNGRSFIMRICPYKTMNNVTEGAVITFVDISEKVLLKEKLLRMSTVILDSRDAITMQDLDGRTIAWNPAATKIYGWTEEEALSMNVRDRIPLDIREDAVTKLVQLSKSEILVPYKTKRMTKSGNVIEVWITATALINNAHQVYAVATTERMKIE